MDICWFDKIPDTPRNQNDPITEEEQKLFIDFWLECFIYKNLSDGKLLVSLAKLEESYFQ